jgi:K+ transporter
VPAANTFLFVCVILFVLTFRSSSALASAYGVAVMSTMYVTPLTVARSMELVMVARDPCLACSCWSTRRSWPGA